MYPTSPGGGVGVVSAYSWARSAILVAGKGSGGMFFISSVSHYSYSSFSPVSIFHLLFYLIPFFGRQHKMTHKVDVSLYPNTISQSHCHSLYMTSIILKEAWSTKSSFSVNQCLQSNCLLILTSHIPIPKSSGLASTNKMYPVTGAGMVSSFVIYLNHFLVVQRNLCQWYKNVVEN